MCNIGFLGRWGGYACPQCLSSMVVTLSLSEAGPGRFSGQPSSTDIYHTMHGLRSCLSARTQPLTATGAPSQTSTIPYHTIPCHTPCIRCSPVYLVKLSLSEAGPERFGGQLSFTDIYHTIPYHARCRQGSSRGGAHTYACPQCLLSDTVEQGPGRPGRQQTLTD